jgi:hypothetical protein
MLESFGPHCLQGGPKISFYHYIYNGRFLAPFTVTPLHAVEEHTCLLDDKHWKGRTAMTRWCITSGNCNSASAISSLAKIWCHCKGCLLSHSSLESGHLFFLIVVRYTTNGRSWTKQQMPKGNTIKRNPTSIKSARVTYEENASAWDTAALRAILSSQLHLRGNTLCRIVACTAPVLLQCMRQPFTQLWWLSPCHSSTRL